MVQTFFIGLVSGKTGSGETSAGFKHAAILMIVALALLPLVNHVTSPLQERFEQTPHRSDTQSKRD